MAATLAGGSSSLGADLDPSTLLGEWREESENRHDETRVVVTEFGQLTIPPSYLALTFLPDGTVESMGVAQWEGLGMLVRYDLAGSTLTFDLGPYSPRDGWVFPDHLMVDGEYRVYGTTRLTCTIALTEDRMSLSGCEAINGEGDPPLTIEDSVWSRPRPGAGGGVDAVVLGT